MRRALGAVMVVAVGCGGGAGGQPVDACDGGVPGAPLVLSHAAGVVALAADERQTRCGPLGGQGEYLCHVDGWPGVPVAVGQQWLQADVALGLDPAALQEGAALRYGVDVTVRRVVVCTASESGTRCVGSGAAWSGQLTAVARRGSTPTGGVATAIELAGCLRSADGESARFDGAMLVWVL